MCYSCAEQSSNEIIMTTLNFDRALRLMQLKADEELNASNIKKAYIKAALLWHPDKNVGNPLAEVKFKIICSSSDLI